MLKLLFPINMILLLSSISGNCQNLWVNVGRIIDFNYDPPKLTIVSHEDKFINTYFPSLSDSAGNLLLATIDNGVYDKNFQIITEIEPAANVIMFPSPNTPNKYYIVYYAFVKERINYLQIEYIPDSETYEIKNKGIIATRMEHVFTIAGGCGYDFYWLICKEKESGNKLSVYKIDETGIALNPVISDLGLPFSFYLPNTNMEVSPASDKLAFCISNYSEYFQLVCLFDISSGKIHTPLPIKTTIKQPSHVEFSSNSQFAYLAFNFELHQVNLSDFPKNVEQKRILKTNQNLWTMEIAYNGKIYVEGIEYGSNFLSELYVIHNPNQESQNIKVEKAGLQPIRRIPNMLSSFANPGHSPNILVDAIDSVKLCEGSSIYLAESTDSSINYSWSPEEHLDNHTIGNPQFHFNQDIRDNKSLKYVVTGNKGICTYLDTTIIEIIADPEIELKGPASVCPFIQNVDYIVDYDASFSYQWQVTGGKMVSPSDSHHIQVDWRETSDQASIEVLAKNSLGCPNDKLVKPIRINVELKPETPNGLKNVCDNLKVGVNYEVSYTQGSSYTWGIQNGNIIEGQGSHSIDVEWWTADKHKLWIAEQSTTVDTVCFGVSDTLSVVVFEDSTDLVIDYVTIDRENDSLAQLYWHSNAPCRLAKQSQINRIPIDGFDWNNIGLVPASQFTFMDETVHSDSSAFDYSIQNVNGCKQEIVADPHTTIHLRGTNNPNEETIDLRWNAYEGWADNLSHYELWRRLDDENKFELVYSFEKDQIGIHLENGRDGFDHRFKIKAVHNSQNFNSWSNEIEVRFDHKLEIPNVFTPNGDQYNPTFFIDKLELYPDNYLKIVDRTGKIVFEKIGYKGDWDGFNFPSGTYYYHLSTGTKKEYKGWVKILK